MVEMFTEEHNWADIRIACPCVAQAQKLRAAGRPVPRCPMCGGRGSVPVKAIHPEAWFCSCRVLNVDGKVCGSCKEPRSGPERSVQEHGQAEPGHARTPIVEEKWIKRR